MKKVQPAVVVEVGETGAPAPVPNPGACFIGDIGEVTLAVILVKTVAGNPPWKFYTGSEVVDACHKPIEVAIIIVIAHGAPHAIFVRYNSRGHQLESAVLVAGEDLARAVIT